MRTILTVCLFGIALSACGNKDAAASPTEASRLRECMRVGMVPITLMPLTMKGTTATSPDDRIKVAKTLEDMIPKVSEQKIKDDIKIIADDVRRQANQPRMVDNPQSVGALNDIKAWATANCGKDKFPELQKLENNGSE